MEDIFFPTDSIISMLYVMEDGHSAEIAMIGNEGVVGIALFMGGLSTPSRAIVQSGGHAYRLDRRHLMAEFDLHGDFHHLLLRYTQTLITQELIANLLGVRRESVTKAANKLQEAAAIRYQRGHITILDRPELERRCCECYAAVSKEFDRLFGAISCSGTSAHLGSRNISLLSGSNRGQP
jgi:CRP-like cAMP-binding protein